MPDPVFCCFWFQKSYTGNILGIARFEDRSSYFYRAEAADLEGVEEGQQGSHTWPIGTASPGPTPRVRVGALPSADSASSPIYSSSWENPRYTNTIPRKVPPRPSSSTLV